nr:MAG TPA: Repressor protein CI [Caudoviricetes sp.]
MKQETMYDRIRRLREDKDISQEELARRCGYSSRSTISKIEKGERNLTGDKIQVIADVLGVRPSYLMDGEEPTSLRAPEVTEDTVIFPVIGEIAAGYDYPAYEDWSGETVEIPKSYLHGRSRDDFFVLSVKGDSMYPQYMDGDKVLILKQSTMNRSGEIGAIIYDGDMATLKKIEYVDGEDWVKLIPINPEYTPKTIRNEDLEQCHVLGIPRLLVREIEQ